jgi:hypothetical protein
MDFPFVLGDRQQVNCLKRRRSHPDLPQCALLQGKTPLFDSLQEPGEIPAQTFF